MKNFKQLFVGLVVGLLLGSTGYAFAGSPTVQVALTNIKFKFDGQDKPLPEGYTVLSYQDRTYVPARFVAEQLGGKVDFDESNNTVLIQSKGYTGNGSTGNLTDLNDQTYKKLPITKGDNGASISINSLKTTDVYTELNLTIANNTQYEWFEFGSVNGVFGNGQLVGTLDSQDGTLKGKFYKGQSKTGNLRIAKIPDGVDQFIITLRANHSEVKPMVFYVQL